jgi:hypothetical protein
MIESIRISELHISEEINFAEISSRRERNTGHFSGTVIVGFPCESREWHKSLIIVKRVFAEGVRIHPDVFSKIYIKCDITKIKLRNILLCQTSFVSYSGMLR